MTDFDATSQQGPRADTGKRFLAFVVDYVILIVISLVLGTLLKGAGSGLGLLIFVGYFAFFDGSDSGQTPGKRLMGIRVIDFQTGGPLGYGKGLLRCLGRILSSIPCLLGYLWAIWDKQHQGWHDKIAGTVVVPVDAYPVSSWP